MLPLLSLGDKQVYFDGDSITQEEVLQIAGRLLSTWGQVHPKIRAMLLYEWEPRMWNDCPHEETLAEALERVSWDERESAHWKREG